MKTTAPWIDENLFRFSSEPAVAGPEMQRSMPDNFEAISPIRAEGEDEVRQMWIRAKRGTISPRPGMSISVFSISITNWHCTTNPIRRVPISSMQMLS